MQAVETYPYMTERDLCARYVQLCEELKMERSENVRTLIRRACWRITMALVERRGYGYSWKPGRDLPPHILLREAQLPYWTSLLIELRYLPRFTALAVTLGVAD